MVGVMARRKISASWCPVKADTAKRLPRDGTKSTQSRRIIPAAKAPALAGLLLNPRRRIE